MTNDTQTHTLNTMTRTHTHLSTYNIERFSVWIQSQPILSNSQARCNKYTGTSVVETELRLLSVAADLPETALTKDKIILFDISRDSKDFIQKSSPNYILQVFLTFCWICIHTADSTVSILYVFTVIVYICFFFLNWLSLCVLYLLSLFFTDWYKFSIFGIHFRYWTVCELQIFTFWVLVAYQFFTVYFHSRLLIAVYV